MWYSGFESLGRSPAAGFSVRGACEHAFVPMKETAETVRRGLAEGRARAEIARDAGISVTAVSRYALIFRLPHGA